MIRTQVQPKGENNSTFRGVTPYMEELMGRNQQDESDTQAGDEFSKLMDKIAARFSENLGFDYTNLLGQVPVQQQIKETTKASKKAERGNEDEKTEAQATVSLKSTSEFHAHVKTKEKGEKKEEKSETSPKETKEVKEGKEVKKADEQTSEKVQAEKVKVQEEGNKEVKAKKSEKTSEEVPVGTAEAKEVKVEESTEQSTEVKEAKEVKGKSDKSQKNAKSEVKEDAGQEENTDAAAEAAVNTEAAKTPESSEVSAEAKAKEGSTKEVSPLNTQSNSSVLASLVLSSAFTSKDIINQSQAANSTQNVQNIADIVKDKIVASMSSVVNTQNNSGSMSGSFSLKANSEKAQNLKEKTLIQQPQMFKAFEKVESALKEAAKAKDGKTISLRLDPPNLGTVKIDVSMRDGGLHARINADNNTISALLREHSQDLQQALRKLGINVDSITVSVTEGFQTDVGHSNGENAQHEQNAEKTNETLNEGFTAGVEVKGGESAPKTESNNLDHWVA